MVSTRSQSQLSDSSLHPDNNVSNAPGAEVTSKQTSRVTRPRTTTRRPGKEHQQRQHQQTKKQLEAIEEELEEHDTEEQPTSGPARTTRTKTNAVSALVDQVATSIFAALEQGFGDSTASSSSDEGEGEDDDVNVNKLEWRVSHNEINAPEQPTSARERALASNSKDSLLSDKYTTKQPLAKSLHLLPPDSRAIARATRTQTADTAGKNWFDLPATTITDEVKNDLRILRLRSAYDPKTFYKKFDETKFPKYFQFGRVVEGPTEYYSSRMTKKERKRTLTEEIMSDPHLTAVRRKRYAKMQEAAAAAAPTKGRRTENSRLVKKPRRPKH